MQKMTLWIVAAVAVALCGWLALTVRDQAQKIESMGREIERLRHDADFWPQLVRTELLRFEVRLRAWMEERDGDEERETRR